MFGTMKVNKVPNLCVKVFSDKTETNVKRTVKLKYPVHVLLLKCSTMFRLWLILNEPSVLGFLSTPEAEEWRRGLQIEV